MTILVVSNFNVFLITDMFNDLFHIFFNIYIMVFIF